jgi:hypothetical protein
MKNMKKHSLKDLEKQRAEAAARGLLGFLNLPDDFERGTVTETVAAGDDPPVTLSEHAITRQDIDRLKIVLTTLNELQQRARKGQRISESDREPINQELRRYHYFTQLQNIDSEQAYFRNEPVNEPGNEMGRVFAQSVVAVAQYGLLGRVRCCLQRHERPWFLATRRHSLFCSTPCQQKYWRALPEVRAKARDYQRKYYRNELSPVTRKQRRRKAS